jgi:hypothetical protein
MFTLAGCARTMITPGVYIQPDTPGPELHLRADHTGEFRVPYRGAIDVAQFKWRHSGSWFYHTILLSNTVAPETGAKIRNITPTSYELLSFVGTDENGQLQQGWVTWTLQSQTNEAANIHGTR